MRENDHYIRVLRDSSHLSLVDVDFEPLGLKLMPILMSHQIWGLASEMSCLVGGTKTYCRKFSFASSGQTLLLFCRRNKLIHRSF